MKANRGDILNIKEKLEKGHSKLITSEIVQAVLEGKARMDDLMICFFSDNHRICQRAAWPVGIIGEKNPILLKPYIKAMIEAAKTPLHNAITRNVVRAFQFMKFSQREKGLVYDFCFQLVSDVKQAIAVRCFAFRTCLHIAMDHNELFSEIRELMTILELDSSPGVQSVLRQARKTVPNVNL